MDYVPVRAELFMCCARAADGYDDIWLSNADNAQTRQLFGADSSASQLFLAKPAAFPAEDASGPASIAPGELFARVPQSKAGAAKGRKRKAGGGGTRWKGGLGIPAEHSEVTPSPRPSLPSFPKTVPWAIVRLKHFRIENPDRK